MTLWLAFLEGLVLVVSPCILPVLPIVLSGGLSGGRQRPIGIILGFLVAFTVFTLLSRKLVVWIGLDTEIIRQVSFYLLLVFGLLLVSDFLSERFAGLTQGLANWGQRRLQAGNHEDAQNQGLLSGFLIGLPIGLVWTPCAGPILAVVIVQTIRDKTDLQSLFTVLAFGLGAALPMLLITLYGRKLMTRLAFLKTRSGQIRKAFGWLLIATVLLTAQGSLFKPLAPAAAVPSSSPKSRSVLKSAPKMIRVTLIDGVPQPYAAPEFSDITAWINTKPLTIASLRGKVVLIDFWTYSCINCVRTLPTITGWDQKYRNQGLVIIGVHAPEFDFEKKLENVQNAVREHHIHYAVALDNNFATWTRYQNQYWPAQYLIDRAGRVVYTHFGEGDEATTEHNILALLGAGMPGPAINKKSREDEKPDGGAMLKQTPETYLGSARAERRVQGLAMQRNEFENPLPLHHWSLSGEWHEDPEKIVTLDGQSALRLRFFARKVFLVMGGAQNKPQRLAVLLDGKLLRTVTVQAHTLYTVLSLDKSREGLLELRPQSPGLEAYAFTFGS